MVPNKAAQSLDIPLWHNQVTETNAVLLASLSELVLDCDTSIDYICSWEKQKRRPVNTWQW